MVNNIVSFVCVLGLFVGLSGCTDAERSKLFAFGGEHTVRCYSGGTVIYEGTASGKVLSEDSSDGYYFKDKATGRLMEVSGNCVITRI